MLVSNDEDALPRLAAQGDRRAFATLVRLHEARVRGFLARLAGRQAADDLAQETFLRAWRHASRFAGTGSYAAWLLAIAWRAFLDDQRRYRAERSGLSGVAVEPEDHHPDPAAKIDVDRLFALLDPDERACLALCLGQGWSYHEAAEILAIPLGTLKSRLSRATSKCRRMLDQ